MERKTALILGAVLVVSLGSASVLSQSQESGQEMNSNSTWTELTLNDVNSGESYTIKELDKPVVVEPFAVWCSVCLRQQKEIKRLRERGTEITFLSLNTDSNEDAARVREHTERHGFDWRYSVASGSMTRMLRDNFGSGVLVPPRSPKVVVCGDGTQKRLSNGVKPPEALVNEVEEAC